MYLNENGQVLNVSEMTAEIEQEFVAFYEAFGANDYNDNLRMLSDADFDGATPSAERVGMNIDDSYELEDADDETIAIARKAYVRGWKRAHNS